MRYDWNEINPYREFSVEFFREIDRRFFSEAAVFLPPREIPFDSLIPFAELPELDVLEIGVGNGSHAALLASAAKSFVGLDLTEYASRSTGERLRRFGLKGSVVRMDAEQLGFPSNSFDFVWSWGVIHHSSDTGRVLDEIRRVLRPGGRAVTMVYHRNVWNYYVVGGLFHGLAQGDLFHTRSIHHTVQRFQDGALARFYTRREWRVIIRDRFLLDDERVMGSKAELVPLPNGRVKGAVVNRMPDSASRFLTNRLGLGTFLVSSMHKPSR